MIIDKIASDIERNKIEDYYYDSAREGMFDLLKNMTNEGLINTIFLPGYIGWSQREGSGIFDPINKLKELTVQYYKMNSQLDIDLDDLEQRIRNLSSRNFAVLIVNYFGFIDPRIEELSSEIKRHKGWIIEDNAHGFFTNLYSNIGLSDATFFSLHKMFPFSKGGSLRIINERLKAFDYCGNSLCDTTTNPWLYDVKKIAFARRNNYEHLEKLINLEKYLHLFKPLKKRLNQGIVPQTFPILIERGDRNRIYRLMNDAGYGVVSLYHTLIEPLRIEEYKSSLNLSQHILNLPVHQDVDLKHYEEMISLLAKYCEMTS